MCLISEQGTLLVSLMKVCGKAFTIESASLLVHFFKRQTTF